MLTLLLTVVATEAEAAAEDPDPLTVFAVALVAAVYLVAAVTAWVVTPKHAPGGGHH